MIWPFARKPKVEDRRGWNEDWQVGDLAECVKRGSWPFPEPCDPQHGDFLRVSHLLEGEAPDGVLISALGFEGKPGHLHWQCTSFRKLRPQHEPADTAFTALIRRKRSVPA